MSRRLRTLFFTRFIQPEGKHDRTFLRLLKQYYQTNIINTTIGNGHGKTQTEIIRETIRKPGDYDNRTVVMDRDKDSTEMQEADRLAGNNNIDIVRNFPCIEGALIKILEPNKKLGGMSSHALKDYFEEKYIPHNKRGDVETYEKIFPKELLDSARKRVPELDAMIKLMEEK